MDTKIIFHTTGLEGVVTANIYRLTPTIEQAQDTGDKIFRTDNPSIPFVSGTNMVGNYLVVPLFLVDPQNPNKKLEIPEAIVNINKRKNIVQTEIVGGYGTVKEYINDGDIEMSIIIGIIAKTNDNKMIDRYPTSELRELIEILDAKNAIQITSDFLKIFGIDGGIFNAVITDYSIEQSSHSNHQIVNISAISDYDYVIFEEEN